MKFATKHLSGAWVEFGPDSGPKTGQGREKMPIIFFVGFDRPKARVKDKSVSRVARRRLVDPSAIRDVRLTTSQFSPPGADNR